MAVNKTFHHNLLREITQAIIDGLESGKFEWKQYDRLSNFVADFYPLCKTHLELLFLLQILLLENTRVFSSLYLNNAETLLLLSKNLD